MGSGSWGTALAIVLADNGFTAALWGRDAGAIDAMRDTGINSQYLPGVDLPSRPGTSHRLARVPRGCRAGGYCSPQQRVSGAT